MKILCDCDFAWYVMNDIYENELEHAAIHSCKSCREWKFCDNIELGGIKRRIRGERLMRTNCEALKRENIYTYAHLLARKGNSVISWYDIIFTPPSFDVYTYIYIYIHRTLSISWNLIHYWYFLRSLFWCWDFFCRCLIIITHRCATVTRKTRFSLSKPTKSLSGMESPFS